jgi:predicted Zn-dependent peptidase
VLLAWPLAVDPVQRDEQSAVIEMLAQLVPTQVNASTSLLELGGARGRMLAIAMFPADGTSDKDAIAGVERARFRLQDWFGSGLFEASRERAVFHIVESLDEGVDRSRWMAEDAFAGRDVDETLRARIAAVHGLSRDRAKAIAAAFTVESASILTLVPDDSSAVTTASLAPAIHEMPRTVTADPAAAQSPAPRPDASMPAVQASELASGLRVVLIPSSSVRTFDARLVILAGTAAEPAAQRGVALLAAHGLRPNSDDGADMLRFFIGGGAFDVDVHADATVFSVAGVAGQLDQSLVALGELVENGEYDSFDDEVRDLALDTHLDPDVLLATRIWRTALYGERHPYVDAGLWQRASRVSRDQVSAFRTAHYVPTGATLLITGGFDAALAAKWADYAFGDWRGTPAAATIPTARPEPFAYAQARATSQIAFRAAVPIAARDRVAGLVAADMLATALSDVREQLAASYGVSAALAESRAGTSLAIAGNVDAARAAEAFGLIRDRIAQLRAATPDTAARFVEARKRVLDRLMSVPAGAAALADRAEDAIELGRTATDDATTAEAVRTLTLDRALPVLQALDLQHAAMLLTGPDAAVTAAYKALGREPVMLHR